MVKSKKIMDSCPISYRIVMPKYLVRSTLVVDDGVVPLAADSSVADGLTLRTYFEQLMTSSKGCSS